VGGDKPVVHATGEASTTNDDGRRRQEASFQRVGRHKLIHVDALYGSHQQWEIDSREPSQKEPPVASSLTEPTIREESVGVCAKNCQDKKSQKESFKKVGPNKLVNVNQEKRTQSEEEEAFLEFIYGKRLPLSLKGGPPSHAQTASQEAEVIATAGDAEEAELKAKLLKKKKRIRLVPAQQGETRKDPPDSAFQLHPVP
jgi:hypothetical protein